MSRVQLALNVSDLDAAIAFYGRLFATEPAKVRPGYANFAIVDPPLKLVLIAGDGAPGSLNHLGVEVETPAAGRGRAASGWPTTASPPRPRTRSRVATRCRTRCGSTARTRNRGRSTRSCAMSRWSRADLGCDAAPESASRCC